MTSAYPPSRALCNIFEKSSAGAALWEIGSGAGIARISACNRAPGESARVSAKNTREINGTWPCRPFAGLLGAGCVPRKLDDAEHAGDGENASANRAARLHMARR